MTAPADATLLGWLTAPRIMAIVAAVLAAVAIAIWTRPAISEGAVYARRIAGTMAGAAAVVLAMFAWSMASWGPGR